MTVKMRRLALFLSAWLLWFIGGTSAQRVRTGGCPVVPKRANCSALVWDECTCDRDCPTGTKCCFRGCNHACASPGAISVTNKADVVFIMDSSGSIGTSDYAKERGFVKEMAKIFQISPTASRISTIIYDSRPALIFDFDEYTDVAGVSNAIDSLPYLGNQTRIDKALALAVRVFGQSRPSVPRIAVILTDGKQTPDFDAVPLEVAAQPLHDLGVKVYVIGIGGHVDINELNLIAKKPQDVFTVGSFDQLLRVLQQFLTLVDKPEALPPVNLTSDVLFLLDSSSNIPRSSYNEQNVFLKDLFDAFTISPDYTRAGVITYGETARLSIALDEFSTNEDLKAALDGLPYLGGAKRLDRALVLADQTFAKSRIRVPKIAIVFTYGRMLSVSGSSYIESAVRSLRRNGVSIFVIAIGESLDFNELGKLVKKPLDIASDPTFGKLQPYVGSIARYIVANADITAPLDPRTDVVFLLDGAGNITREDFKRQQEFVKSLAKSFKISTSGPRAGIVVYGQRAYPMVRPSDYTSLEDFLSVVRRARVVGGDRRLAVGLTTTASLLSRQGRDGAKVVIVLSGGKNSNQTDKALGNALKLLRTHQARVYVVGVGPNLSSNQLRRLVLSAEDVFSLPSFISLPRRVLPVAQHVSRNYDTRSFQADVVLVLDSSIGVRSADFEAQQQFAKALAEAFNVGSGTRMALIIYSDTTLLTARFSDSSSVGEFQRLVDDALFLDGPRRLDKALEKTATVFSTAREGYPKVAVLVAAGRQSQSAGSKPLDVASRALKELGVARIVLAAGDRAAQREVRVVVDRDSDVFWVQSMASLVAQATPIVQYIVTNYDYPDVKDLSADIIFILDSSRSVRPGDYERQKDFIKAMAQSLNVSPDKSRMAIITYGDKAQTAVRFSEDTSSLRNIPYVGGEGRVDTALRAADTLLRSTRASVPKIILLLAGSGHASGVGSQTLTTLARSLRILDGRVFAVAVSAGADLQKLYSIVETPSHLFRISSYGSLAGEVQMISKKIAVESATRSHRGFSSDVVFVMDSSSTVNEEDYQKEKSFVKSVAKTLNVSPGNSRAALVTYGDRSSRILTFDILRSSSEFDTAVNNSPHVGGGRRVDLALDEVAGVLTTARSGVPVIVVLLVAGKQSRVVGAKALFDAAKPLHGQNRNVYVVAVGREADLRELGRIVIRPSDIFSQVSFAALSSQAGIIGRSIQEGSLVPRPLDVDADVIFVLDSSSGVTREDFDKQKNFVKRMATYLNVSPQKSRAALVTFGSTSRVAVTLNGYGTLTDFYRAVDGALRVGGARRTDRALAAVASLLNEARPHVPRLVLLITAGPQAQQPGTRPIAEAVGPVRQNRGSVYALAVGSRHDSSELRDLVQHTRDIFTASSLDTLLDQVFSIANSVARTTEASHSYHADILFIMDSSSSVSLSDFSKQKQFVKAVGKYLNVSPWQSQAAVLSYGSVPTAALTFGGSQSRETFERTVDEAPFQGGQRRLDRALQEGAHMLRDARQLTPKVVLLLTAGAQSSDQGLPTLEEASEPLRHLGAAIFVVAIGQDVDAEELSPLVKNPEDIFELPSFNMLVPEAVPFAAEVSERTEKPAVPQKYQADIIFIVDSSSLVSREDYNKEKRLVQFLARQLKMSPSGSRAALVTYGYAPVVVARFDSYPRIADFDNEVNRAPYIGGASRLDLAFRRATSLLAEARPLIPTLVIVLTAGWRTADSDLSQLVLALQPFRRHGAKVFVMPHGGYYTDPAQSIVEQARDILPVSSLDVSRFEAELLASAMAQNSAPYVPQDFRADVIFVVDSSSGVRPQDYNREKTFVKSLAQLLNVSPDKSRAALITYGSYAEDVFGFDDYQTIAAFEALVDGARAIGGSRRTDRALEFAGGLVQAARSTVPRIVIILTAGKQSSASGVKPLDIPAKALRDIGGRLFVVAIGAEPDVDKLVAATESPADVFSLSSFGDLAPKPVPIAGHVAKQFGLPVPDGFQADVIFLMDASHTVRYEDYSKQKSFVKAVASLLDVSPGESRAAVITYGYTAVQVTTFDSYGSLAGFDRAVDRAPDIGGSRRIDSALKKASGLLSDARTYVPTIVILLLSGKQAFGSGARVLGAAAKPLRDRGVAIHAISIGAEPDISELDEVVGELRFIFFVPSFDGLQSSGHALAGKVATQTVAQPKVHDIAADIIFLVDSSSGAGRVGFEKQKHFVKSVATSLNVAPGKSRAAFVLYSTHARLAIPLIAHSTRGAFNAAVDSLTFIGRSRRMDRALDGASVALRNSRGGVPKIVILLTTGQQSTEVGARPLDEAARPLQDVGATVYVVAIGNDVKNDEVESVVQRPDDDVFPVASLDDLLAQSASISNAIAENLARPKRDNYTADIVFLVDSSSNVAPETYKKEKELVAKLSDTLNLAPNRSRVAILLYGEYPTRAIAFDVYSTPARLQEGLEALVYIQLGKRRIDRALTAAARRLAGQDRPVHKDVVLITVGKQSRDASSLAVAVQPLVALGARVFVVAVGSGPDLSALSKAVERRADIMPLPRFDDLNAQALTISDYIRNRGVDLCRKTPCNNGGTCVATPGGYSCSCAAGFHGDNCENDVDECTRTPCRNGGRCTNTLGTYRCSCPTGFKGRDCETDVDECTNNPCNNGGTCRNKHGGYTCSCPAGFQGDNCETGVDECDQSPCQNGGTCTNTRGSYSCACPAGFQGSNCDEEIPIIRRDVTAEILLVMDASSDVQQEGFDAEKEFVKSLAQTLNIAQGKARVGIIVYSDFPRIPVMLGNYRSAEDFVETVNALGFNGGNRRMDTALQASQIMFISARPGVPKFVILLTGGRQYGSQTLNVVGRLLKLSNIKTLVVAIGPRVDFSELQPLIENRGDIFAASNFANLKLLVQEVADMIDEKSTTEVTPGSTTEVVTRTTAAETTLSSVVSVQSESTTVVIPSTTLPTTRATTEVSTLPTAPDTTPTTASTTIELTTASTTTERETTPSTVADTTPTTERETTPSTVADTTPTTERETTPSTVADTTPTTERETTPSTVTDTTPTTERETTPSMVTDTTPTTERETAPSTVTDTTPTTERETTQSTEPDTTAVPTPDITPSVEPDSTTSKPTGFTPSVSPKTTLSTAQEGTSSRMRDTTTVAATLRTTMTSPTTSPQPPTHSSAEILFLVDSSSDVGSQAFQSQKNFVKQLGSILNVDPALRKAAVVAYGSEAEVSVRFDSYQTGDGFARLVDNIQSIGGARRLDLALNKAEEILRQGDPSAVKKVIVLTAGRQDQAARPLREAVQPLRDLKARIFVVAVGVEPSTRELRPLVDELEDVFRVPSPEALMDDSKRMGQAVEEGLPLFLSDVVFIMDSSATVTPQNFENEKRFVKSLAKSLGVGEGNTRAALLVYSNNPQLIIDLGEYNSFSEFESKVDRSPLIGQSRRIDKVLAAAAEVLSGSPGSARRTVFLITSGPQSQESSAIPPAEAVAPLRGLGAKLYVIAVGRLADKSDFLDVVEKPTEVLKVPSFTKLPSMANTIHVLMTTGKIPGSLELDILFLVDSSGDVGQANFDTLKEFVKSVSRTLSTSTGKLRAGVISFGSQPWSVARLTDYTVISAFADAVDNSRYAGGLRRVDRALKAAEVEFEADGDLAAPRVVLLLTAGPGDGGEQLGPYGQLLLDLGARTYVVVVGEGVPRDEFAPLVHSSGDLFPLPSYSSLQSQGQQISYRILNPSRPTPREGSDVVYLIDASQGVSFQQFSDQKGFVKSSVRALLSKLPDSRPAVAVYADTHQFSRRLSDIQLPYEFERALQRAPLLGGARRMDRALEAAAQELSSSTEPSRAAVILLTVGRQSLGERALDIAARGIHDLGASLYIVSIGTQPVVGELLPAVHKASDVIRVFNSSQLAGRASKITDQISSEGEAYPQMYADVVFVMDSSYDVDPEADYTKQKDLVKRMARNLEVSKGKARAAVITYGNSAPLVSRFESDASLEELYSVVDGAPYVGGMRRLDRALESVIRLTNEARENAPKVVVLFAAGGQESDAGLRSLADASQVLRDAGVQVVVVAVGSGVNMDQLRLVAEQQNIVVVASFEELPAKAEALSLRVEQSSGHLKPEDFIADIVFLVDSSDNVTSDSYERQKTFVTQLARSLNIAPGKSRAALITYSTNPLLAFSLEKHDTISEFASAVNSAFYLGGSRRVDKALGAAANILRGARTSVLKIVFLLTAGKRTESSDASLGDAMRPLRDLGALTYAVAIGGEPDAQELQQELDGVAQVPAPGDLPRYTGEVVKQVYTGASERLRFAADIVFVVDSSTSVDSQTFQQQKDFVKSLARYLNIAAEKSRAALILYNSDASVIGSLVSYTELGYFEQAVQNAPFLGGQRRIDRALEAAARVLSRGRESVPKFAILLTTGRQAEVPGITPLDLAAESLRDVNAKAFVLAIGKETSIRELRLIVEDPNDVIPLYSEADMVSKVADIAGYIRRGASLVRHPAISRADVVFLLDSSDGVSADTFIEEKEFIKSVARHFAVSRDRTRAAVVRYASDAAPVITMDTYGNLLDFNGAIDRITSTTGQRRLDEALVGARETLANSRDGVPKVVIVLTSGRQVNPPGFAPASTAARSLRSNGGASVYVVGIGARPDLQELKDIAGRESNVFLTSSAELRHRAPQVVMQIASSIEAPLPNGFNADILFLMDSSQTISPESFQAQKDFVKSVARYFEIIPTRTRSGVVNFGSDPTMSIQLNDYTDVHSFVRAVDVVPLLGGGKRLDKALVYAARILSKGRRGAQKIALVLTDGRQGSHVGADQFRDAARALHSLGVKTYAVGVGDGVNFGVMSAVSVKPDDVFYVRTFARLLQLAPSVTSHIISDSLKSTSLMQRRDGMFLVDSSALLSADQFETQIDFIKAIAKHLDVSPTRTRLAVITYNSRPQLSVNFTSYTSLSELYNLLDGLPQLQVGRRLDKALQLAVESFTLSPSDIPRFLVVLAEGRYDLEPGVRTLAQAVQPLHGMGVTVYVVSIGRSVGLDSIVDKPENILTVQTASALLWDVGRIAEHIDSTIRIPCKATLDVGFLLDASSSVGIDQFTTEKNFVKLLSEEILTASPNSRAGVIVFSDYPILSLTFSDFAELTPSRFEALIGDLPYQTGRTRIDLALGMASRKLFVDKRDSVDQVMILITDGRQSHDPGYTPLNEAVKPLRAQNITMLPVGIGGSVDVGELRVLAGNTQNVFLVQSFDELSSIVRRLVARSCQG